MKEIIPAGCEVLLMCEGGWDVAFLKAISNHMRLTVTPISIGGKEEFRSGSIRNICLAPGFQELRAFGVILDANGSAPQTLARINGVFRDCLRSKPNFLQHGEVKQLKSREFPAMQVGAFIVPDGESSGELEDMLLKSVRKSHPQIMGCVDTFRDCIDLEVKSKSRKKSKQSLQTFLSGLGKHCPDLNVALRERVIDLDSDAFTELREFLQTLSNA